LASLRRTRAALVAIHSGSPKQWVNSAAGMGDLWDCNGMIGDDIWLVVTGTMEFYGFPYILGKL